MFAIELCQMVATTFIKISILLFCRRLSSGSFIKAYDYAVFATLFFVVGYFISCTIAIIFLCNPVEGFWQRFNMQWRQTHTATCQNEGALTVAGITLSTVQDFIICALPVFLVWNLQVPRRQRIALIALFGLGLMSVFSITVLFVHYSR